MSFQIALSGLDAASTALEVTSNNIANSRTNGFKESRPEFSDVYATSISDSSSTAAGRGVRVNKIAQLFNQGTVDFTSRNLDLAINGDGFFVLRNDGGGYEYTRAGAYSADRDGFIVNHKLQRLQVYPAQVDAATGDVSFPTGVLQDLQLPLANSAPQATANVTTAINLDAADDVLATPFATAGTGGRTIITTPPAAATPPDTVPTAEQYNYSTSLTVYDSLGAAHTLSLYYVKDGGTPNAWNVFSFIDGFNITDTANNRLVFNSDGSLDAANSSVPGSTLDIQFDGAAFMQLDTNVDSMTQYGGDFAVSNITQDGYATGRLSGLDIDTEGVAFARYTNGQATALGKVAMARFNSPQNLTKLGDTNWGESFASGQPLLGEATTSSFGSIQSGALEASNVDLAEQLVNLIVSQRAFQANSKVVTSVDQILQTIINI